MNGSRPPAEVAATGVCVQASHVRSTREEGRLRMPERTTVTRSVRGGASRARDGGQAALDRLTQSVEAAQAALKDLRKELSKGTRDVLEDLDTTLKDARKNVRSVSRTVTKDLEQIQHALATGK